MSLISYIGKIQKFTIWAKYKKKKVFIVYIYRKNTISLEVIIQGKLYRESGQNKKEKGVSLILIYIQKNTYDKIYKKRKAIFSYIRKIP